MAILFLDFFGSDPSKMDQTCKFGEQKSKILVKYNCLPEVLTIPFDTFSCLTLSQCSDTQAVIDFNKPPCLTGTPFSCLIWPFCGFLGDFWGSLSNPDKIHSIVVALGDFLTLFPAGSNCSSSITGFSVSVSCELFWAPFPAEIDS